MVMMGQVVHWCGVAVSVASHEVNVGKSRSCVVTAASWDAGVVAGERRALGVVGVFNCSSREA